MFDVDSWEQVIWPEWVPVPVRKHIEDFWGPTQHRTPRQYRQNACENHAPRLGLRIQAEDYQNKFVAGRFVFSWNNCGRVIGDAGEVYYVGFHGFKVSRGGMWLKPVPADFEENTPVAMPEAVTT